MKIKMTNSYVDGPSKAHELFTIILVLVSKIIYKDYQNLIDIFFIQIPTKTDWSTIAVFDDNCGNLFQVHEDL